MEAVILVRYGEIGLKGRNRPAFEGRLLAAVRRAVAGIEGASVHREFGRLIVTLPGPGFSGAAAALRRLSAVFGVVSVSPAARLPLDLEAIAAGAEALVTDACAERAERPRTFKVDTRRPNKRFPYRTPEINAHVGERIRTAVPELAVDVHAPDLTVYVEVRERWAYVYTEIVPGPGGLPVGASSRALLLLSGGIDSPVAGWLAMKRGILIEAVHFHSPPYTSERSKEKVLELAEILAGYAGQEIPVHVVPFTEVQEAIRRQAPAAMGITLMRRMMLRIAEALAVQREIPALVTGESVGQVASQTLESLRAINAVTNMPVLRPLIAMDKSEIVALAHRIGTYETSVQPFEDCCTLFVPDHPETRPRLERVEAAEVGLATGELVADALRRTELIVCGERALSVP